MASDKVIIKQVLAGNRDAFGDLVQRYEALVQGAVRQRVRCADEAEDLVQEVFCKAYQQLSRLRDLDRFGPWLGRMAANAALDWVRHRRFAAAATTTERIAETYVAGRRPDAALEEEEARLALWAALDRLAPELRKVVVLHHIEGCTQREIAHFLGIALPTLRWRLYRARARLDEELRPLLREDISGKTSVRERVLALLPLGSLWRPLSRTAGLWQRWLALGGAGLGAIAGLGVWQGESPAAAKAEQVPAYTQYRSHTLPAFSVSWAPAKPRLGEKVRLEVAGLTAATGAVLHYIVHPAFPRDRTLPLERQGQVWVGDLTVPVGAKTLFFYPADATEPPSGLCRGGIAVAAAENLRALQLAFFAGRPKGRAGAGGRLRPGAAGKGARSPLRGGADLSATGDSPLSGSFCRLPLALVDP